MRRPGLIGRGWPEDRDVPLLHASIGPPGRAASAWTDFVATNPLDDLWDSESIALLPLVWKRIASTAGDHPELSRLRGVYRKAWFARQLTLSALHSAADVLAAAGIDSALTPGSELTGPVGRAGLVVALGDLGAATSTLARDGWETSGNHHHAPWRGVQRARDTAGTTIELQVVAGRWLVDERNPVVSCERIWSRRRTSTTDGPGRSELSPSDAFIAVCTDGPTPGSPFRLRWSVFADAILDRGVDPGEVIDTSESFGVLPLVASACRFLHLDLGLGQAEALNELLAPLGAQHPERRHLDRIITLGSSGARGAMLRSDWARTRRSWSRVRATKELPGYLADRWGVESPTRLPGAVITRIVHPTNHGRATSRHHAGSAR